MPQIRWTARTWSTAAPKGADIAYGPEKHIVECADKPISKRFTAILSAVYRPYDEQTEFRNRQSSVQGTTLTPPILAAEKGTSKGKLEKALMYSQGPDQHP